MVDRLSHSPGLTCQRLEGAFYAFVDCTGLIGKRSPGCRHLMDDEAIAVALIEEANVAEVHGSTFGLSGYLRIAYALDDDSLQAACRAIEDFCSYTH